MPEAITPVAVRGVQGVIPTSTDAIVAANNAAVPPTDQLGRDAFLKLLVTQLRYQNPLDPSDPAQFMSQTASFTQVEELQKLNAAQGTSQLAQQVSTAASMVGKQITFLEAGIATTGVVTGAKIEGGSTVLVVNGRNVPLTALQSIGVVATTTTTGTTGSGTGTTGTGTGTTATGTTATGTTGTGTTDPAATGTSATAESGTTGSDASGSGSTTTAGSTSSESSSAPTTAGSPSTTTSSTTNDAAGAASSSSSN
jgi:flagellar basal-body rod modification protein FlgD